MIFGRSWPSIAKSDRHVTRSTIVKPCQRNRTTRECSSCVHDSRYAMVVFPNDLPSQLMSTRGHPGPTRKSRKEVAMTAKASRHTAPVSDRAARKTLAEVLAALERHTALSPTRLRDLRSAVMRVAGLLGNVPAGIVF